MAQYPSILGHVMAEALCNHEPNTVRRKGQGAVLAKGDVHRLDQRMASATEMADIDSGPLLLCK